MDRRSCRLRLAEHNRRRRAMTQDRKPRESDSYDSMDDGHPAATGTTDVSSYHTPSNSTPSYISGRTVATETERAYSLSSLPPDVAAAVANLPAEVNIDALLGPLASCLHSMNQILPESQQHYIPQQQQQQHYFQTHQPQQHHAAAPAVDAMMQQQPYGSAFNFGGPFPPQNTQLVPGGNTQDKTAAAMPPSGGLGLSDDALAVLDATDIFSDADLDLALAGILDPVVDTSLPPPPVYTSPDVVVRMSMKFFSCMPSDLPPTLREELERNLQVNASLMEGCVRPGCTHVTVDLRLPADVAARIEATPLDAILEALAKKLPNDHGLLAQLGKQVAALKLGKTLSGGVVDVSGPRGPHLAALSRVCVSVDEAASTRVDLYGANIGRAGDLVLCRQHGEHVTVEMMDTPAWNMVVDEEEEMENNAAIEAENNLQQRERNENGGGNSDDEELVVEGDEDDDASATGVLDVDNASTSVRSGTSSTSGWDPAQPNGRAAKAGCMPATSVRLLGLCCGVAEVEVQAGGVLSAARPLLVLPDAAAAAEVEQLACRARRALWLDAFLRDAGVVVAHICSEGAAARLPGDVVEALAARTSAYCMEAGCPVLGRLLRRAQNALRRAIGNDDTASAMAEMLEGAAKDKVERHLAAEEAGSSDGNGNGHSAIDRLATIPLVENFKGLTIAVSTDNNNTNATIGGLQGQGWKGLVSMAVGAIAIAVAAHVFRS
jgi:hypothetical protein